MNTYYVDVKGIKMCCYCGKQIFSKVSTGDTKKVYQCSCKKAQKQIELEKIISAIEQVFEQDLKIDWNEVELNKNRLLEQIDYMKKNRG